jgi:hypothetical protein
MGKACSMTVENRNAYRLLVGKPEGKRPREDQYIGRWIELVMYKVMSLKCLRCRR